MSRAVVAFGANLGDREATMRRAIELLGDEVVAVSTFRETDPVGYEDQPRFLNAAIALETELGPRELLDRLLAVELELGRRRDGRRFGPRTSANRSRSTSGKRGLAFCSPQQFCVSAGSGAPVPPAFLQQPNLPCLAQ